MPLLQCSLVLFSALCGGADVMQPAMAQAQPRLCPSSFWLSWPLPELQPCLWLQGQEVMSIMDSADLLLRASSNSNIRTVTVPPMWGKAACCSWICSAAVHRDPSFLVFPCLGGSSGSLVWVSVCLCVWGPWGCGERDGSALLSPDISAHPPLPSWLRSRGYSPVALRLPSPRPCPDFVPCSDHMFDFPSVLFISCGG